MNKRFCIHCKQEKLISEFTRQHPKCKTCCQEKRDRTKGKDGQKECEKCHQFKSLENFYLIKKYNGRTNYCKVCYSERQRKRERDNRAPAKERRRLYAIEYNKIRKNVVMLNRAKRRAEKKNLPFNIEVSDIIIPDICPVLGIKLSTSNGVKHTDSSPSLDKIIPELGYIKGNIKVISHRANMLKNNATIEELQKVIQYIKSAQVPNSNVSLQNV